MRAVENGVDAPSQGLCRTVHLFMNGVEGIHVEQAAPDSRLVGGDHHPAAGLGQAGDGFQTAGDGLPFGGRLDELIGVEVDDAVAVKDDEFHTASLEMSATALSCA